MKNIGIAALLCAMAMLWAPDASARGRSADNAASVSTVALDDMGAELQAWAVALGAFGLLGTVLRATKER